MFNPENTPKEIYFLIRFSVKCTQNGIRRVCVRLVLIEICDADTVLWHDSYGGVLGGGCAAVPALVHTYLPSSDSINQTCASAQITRWKRERQPSTDKQGKSSQ